MDQSVVEDARREYPADRDLKKIARQLVAAQRSGKKTKPIVERFDSRLALLNADKQPEPDCT